MSREPETLYRFIRETDWFQQVPDLADHKYIVSLVVASISTPLYRFQLGKFLLPISEHMGLHATKITYLAYSEIAFSRYNW